MEVKEIENRQRIALAQLAYYTGVLERIRGVSNGLTEDDKKLLDEERDHGFESGEPLSAVADFSPKVAIDLSDSGRIINVASDMPIQVMVLQKGRDPYWGNIEVDYDYKRVSVLAEERNNRE